MRKVKKVNDIKSNGRKTTKCPTALDLIIKASNLVHLYTDLPHEEEVYKRLKKEFLIRVEDQSQLTDSFFTPLWLKIFNECYKDFPESYKGEASYSFAIRYLSAETEEDYARINLDLYYSIFTKYRSIRVNREYLLPIVEKINEYRTGRYSHGEPFPIDEFARETFFPLVDLPRPKLNVFFTDDGKLKTSITEISEFAKAIEDIEFDRLRLCPVYDKILCKVCNKIYWASRLDKTACRKEHSDILSQQKRRNENKEAINERRRENYQYKKERKQK